MLSSVSLTDHVTGNAVRVSPADRAGVLTGDLPPGAFRPEQRRVVEILRTYLANRPPAMARRTFARIQRGHRPHPVPATEATRVA